ncbi:hypothetical protein [Methanotorris formicicus]|uniref:hypothetical protein n=1 Tax=Methanotorris formicicus TaxID=213185 RepID=UPI001FDF5A28|nr:hypothetical protein [Methanotorris formicicus]
MLAALNNILTNSINSLGFNCSEELSKFAQVRTLTPIKTIKAFSEYVSGIHRTTIVKKPTKNYQKMSFVCILNYPTFPIFLMTIDLNTLQ